MTTIFVLSHRIWNIFRATGGLTGSLTQRTEHWFFNRQPKSCTNHHRYSVSWARSLKQFSDKNYDPGDKMSSQHEPSVGSSTQPAEKMNRRGQGRGRGGGGANVAKRPTHCEGCLHNLQFTNNVNSLSSCPTAAAPFPPSYCCRVPNRTVEYSAGHSWFGQDNRCRPEAAPSDIGCYGPRKDS